MHRGQRAAGTEETPRLSGIRKGMCPRTSARCADGIVGGRVRGVFSVPETGGGEIMNYELRNMNDERSTARSTSR